MPVKVSRLRPDHQQILGSGLPADMTLSIIQNFPADPLALMNFVKPIFNHYREDVYIKNGYHIITFDQKYEGSYLIFAAMLKNYYGFWENYFYEKHFEIKDDREVYIFNIAKKILKSGA